MSTESFKIGPGAPVIPVYIAPPETQSEKELNTPKIEVETVEEGNKKKGKDK